MLFFFLSSRGDCDAENYNIHGKNIVSLTHQSRAGEVKKMKGVIIFWAPESDKGCFSGGSGIC